MDETTFDRISRLLAASPSRRAVTRLLASLTLGGALASAGSGVTAKRRKKKCRHCDICEQCKQGKCKPKPEGASCGGARICQDNVCVCPTERICGDDCFDLLTDAAHCGSCDFACPAGRRCIHGACACTSEEECPLDETPFEEGDHCKCDFTVSEEFVCIDSNSNCDLDRPCDTNDDCPPRSVCLPACRPQDPNPRRCSVPCN